MKNGIMILVCLLLTSCYGNVKVGKKYKVKSGFYRGCIGEAVNFYDMLLNRRVLLSPLVCENLKEYIAHEDATNLEEIK